MGHSQREKDASHERIVKVAAARFREVGVDGIGVAALMDEAGLTHGGFYRHFDSREALVAEAIERALRDGGEAVNAVAKKSLTALVDAYLSTSHRDHLATSCAVTTLAEDVAHASPRARAAYARQVKIYVDLVVELIAHGSKKERRRKAVTALATLVGAVSMARAVNDEHLSREILKSAGEELKRALAR